jgi:hypothetical protein
MFTCLNSEGRVGWGLACVVQPNSTCVVVPWDRAYSCTRLSEQYVIEPGTVRWCIDMRRDPDRYCRSFDRWQISSLISLVLDTCMQLSSSLSLCPLFFFCFYQKSQCWTNGLTAGPFCRACRRSGDNLEFTWQGFIPTKFFDAWRDLQKRPVMAEEVRVDAVRLAPWMQRSRSLWPMSFDVILDRLARNHTHTWIRISVPLSQKQETSCGGDIWFPQLLYEPDGKPNRGHKWRRWSNTWDQGRWYCLDSTLHRDIPFRSVHNFITHDCNCTLF